MKKYPKSIYLGGSSWGSAFYIGVFKSLREKYGKNIGKKIEVYGDSAGSLLALCFLLNLSIDEMTRIYENLANSAIKNGVIGKMTKYHHTSLDEILKNKDDYKKVNGRLHVGVTFNDKKVKRFSYWNSNEELRHTLLCSFHIPIYCTYNAKMYGTRVLDGCFGANIHDFPKSVITIGMQKEYDISSNLSTKECISPLKKEKMKIVIKDGYEKMNAYDSDRYNKTTLLFPFYIWKILNVLSNP